MRYRKIKIAGKTLYYHRWLMEQHLGRILDRNEWVHHKNENTLDNDLSNLQVMIGVEHARHHMSKNPIVKTCAVCGASFEPPQTKRGRNQTCSDPCRFKLMWITRRAMRKQHDGRQQ